MKKILSISALALLSIGVVDFLYPLCVPKVQAATVLNTTQPGTSAFTAGDLSLNYASDLHFPSALPIGASSTFTTGTPSAAPDNSSTVSTLINPMTFNSKNGIYLEVSNQLGTLDGWVFTTAMSPFYDNTQVYTPTDPADTGPLAGTVGSPFYTGKRTAGDELKGLLVGLPAPQFTKSSSNTSMPPIAPATMTFPYGSFSAILASNDIAQTIVSADKVTGAEAELTLPDQSTINIPTTTVSLSTTVNSDNSVTGHATFTGLYNYKGTDGSSYSDPNATYTIVGSFTSPAFNGSKYPLNTRTIMTGTLTVSYKDNLGNSQIATVADGVTTNASFNFHTLAASALYTPASTGSSSTIDISRLSVTLDSTNKTQATANFTDASGNPQTLTGAYLSRITNGVAQTTITDSYGDQLSVASAAFMAGGTGLWDINYDAAKTKLIIPNGVTALSGKHYVATLTWNLESVPQ